MGGDHDRCGFSGGAGFKPDGRAYIKEGEEKQKTPEGQITSDVFKMGNSVCLCSAGSDPGQRKKISEAGEIEGSIVGYCP